jgi:hypothetical protein
MRELPTIHTGKPAPFRLTAPAYVVAFSGWLAACILLVASAPELAELALYDGGLIAAAHAVGLVFFPFAVAAAVWQLIPVMLRNNPPHPRVRWLVLALLAAGIPLAAALTEGRLSLAYAAAALLGAGLVLFLVELARVVRGAPEGRRLAVNRPPLAIAGAHAALAFCLGLAVLADGGAEPLGIPFENVLLIHLSLASIGWLTVMIAAVGRTLVPMLGLAAAAPPRRVPAAEIALVGGLWVFIVGVASSTDWLVAAGVIAMAAGLAAPARLFARVATGPKAAAREGPVLHVAAGLVFLAEAAIVAVLAAAGTLDERPAAVAGVLLLGLGWAAGVIVGHAGKLVSLSGWGSWPPGPRPTQASLYPRRAWQVEVALFAAGVQVVAAGVLADSPAATRSGSVLLAGSAAVALGGALESIRRVRTLRPRRTST